jgi:hypothetical protein
MVLFNFHYTYKNIFALLLKHSNFKLSTNIKLVENDLVYGMP